MTKSKYRGALILAILIALLSASNMWYNQKKLEDEGFFWEDSESDKRKLDSLAAILKAKLAENQVQKIENRNLVAPTEEEKLPPALHDFDPNTVSREDWVAMRLPDRVFNGLEKYRAKGGKFKKPEQILKLYNLDPELGQQMVPFVKIDSQLFARPKPEWKKIPFPEKPKYVPFNINEADTNQLMSVFGIGRGIANRIVRHRTALGGFFSKAYVSDVFGLDSAVVEELFKKGFLPENPILQKLNINQADEEALAKNPYIRKGLARIIVKYRIQHGNFKKADDLLEIKIMKPEVLEKLKPYLEF